MAPITAELRPAFEWTCDHCGHDQFTRAIVVAIESINLDECDDEIREWIESGESGHFVRSPDQVKCGDCGREYVVVDL